MTFQMGDVVKVVYPDRYRGRWVTEDWIAEGTTGVVVGKIDKLAGLYRVTLFTEPSDYQILSDEWMERVT